MKKTKSDHGDHSDLQQAWQHAKNHLPILTANSGSLLDTCAQDETKSKGLKAALEFISQAKHIKAIRKIEELLKVLKEPSDTISANMLISECFYNLGKLTDSLNALQKAFVVAASQGDNIAMASCLSNQSMILLIRGELDEADRLLDKAQKIFKQ
ncbi:hypothetical protein KKA08_01065, partial [bacterium]|nr:hypothetical protein [bacterium]